MSRVRLIAGLAAAVTCGLAVADTRVEFVGRVADNHLALAPCPGNGETPCPWNSARPGEYIHATFVVTGEGENLVFPSDLILHPNAQARGFDIVNGTYVVRLADLPLNIPVSGELYDPGIPDSGTSPGILIGHNYWTVDSFLVSGGVLTQGGRCCYPSGACTFVYPSDCPSPGVWTFAGACSPSNACAQPLGACCAADNTCTVSTRSGCVDAGSTWTTNWNSGGACAPAACPQIAGACCDSLGNCAITAQSQCPAAWIGGGACSSGACPSPTIIGDYAMDLDHFAHEPADIFASADITQDTGVYPGSLWNISRSWLIFFASQGFPYEMFIDIDRVVISTTATAMGSCCPGDGHCLITTLNACPIAASWQTGGVCGPSTCPTSSGACCLADGSCDLRTPAACATSANSVYQLDGTACTPTICPPTGACCNSGGCAVLIQTACSATGGSWLGAGTTCATQPQHSTTPNGATGLVLPDATFQSTPPDLAAVSTSTLTIADSTTIQSLEVWLNLSTSRINDLKVQLTGPNGATVDLFSRIGTKPPLCQVTPIGPGHPMFTGYLQAPYVFRDSATQSFYDYVTNLSSGAQTAAGHFKPAGCGGASTSLNAAFGGTSLAGTWTLTITDERSGVAATLYSWGLSANGGNPSRCTLGACTTPSGCSVVGFAECTGTWSIGPCAPVACASGQRGACCVFDVCSVMCPSLCPSADGARFAGSGTSCSPTVCLAACCTPSGGCTLATPTNCSGASGAMGSTCSPNTCPQPVACCLASGACLFQLVAACTNGVVGIPGSTCTPNTCPHNPSPANNDCGAVLAVGPSIAADTTINGSADGATADGASPSCGSGVPTADVWWRFTPPATGNYLISSCGNPVWDTSLSVWTSCSIQVPGAGGCADDNCSSSASSSIYGHEKLTSLLAGGVPYLIRVGAFAPTTTNIGAFSLSVTTLGACCNGAAATCALTSSTGCLGGRVFQGLYTSCTPNPCGPMGACCSGSTCSSASAAVCTGANTLFAGEGTICNAFGVNNSSPCCLADYNHIGGVGVQDIFDFLAGYFSASTQADINGGGVGVQDIFDFLAVYFTGC